jgi:hypothetical protein
MTDSVWVVGRWKETTWDLQGVFLTEAGAVEACRDETYFVGPLPLNVALPHETTSWPGAYYPIPVPGA